MKKLIVCIVLSVFALTGCSDAVTYRPAGANYHWYKAHAVGTIESDDRKPCVLFIVKIDDEYYYATSDGNGYYANYHLGSKLSEKAVKKHKERLDF